MVYCPECGAEFNGIRRCPECQVDLVDELPDPSLDDSQEENLVLIKAAASEAEARKIKTFLESQGILCVVESTVPGRHGLPPGTMRVLVNQKDEPRSQELIKTLPA
ncbi:MAG: hypothetical protein AB1898_18330 [Acidobacteriota bacterium]